jgi:hypothetical protein
LVALNRFEHGIEQQEPLAVPSRLEHDEPIWIWNGQRLHHDRVEHDEDCGGCANAGGERRDSQRRERRTASKDPEGVYKVLPRMIEQARTACIAAFFPGVIQSSECEAGPAGGFVTRESCADAFLDLLVEVKLQLVVELTFQGLAPKQRAKPEPQIAPHACLLPWVSSGS